MTDKITAARDTIRFFAPPTTIATRVSDKAVAYLKSGEVDALLAELQHHGCTSLVDTDRGEQITLENMHDIEDLTPRLAPYYSGTDAVTGVPHHAVDHSTASLAIVNHHTTFTEGEVLRVSADSDSISLIRNGMCGIDVHHYFNLGNAIANEYLINLAGTIAVADKPITMENHINRTAMTHALMKRQLVQALAVIEAVQDSYTKVAKGMLDAANKAENDHGSN